jgi:hypothetical protein
MTQAEGIEIRSPLLKSLVLCSNPAETITYDRAALTHRLHTCDVLDPVNVSALILDFVAQPLV